MRPHRSRLVLRQEIQLFGPKSAGGVAGTFGRVRPHEARDWTRLGGTGTCLTRRSRRLRTRMRIFPTGLACKLWLRRVRKCRLRRFSSNFEDREAESGSSVLGQCILGVWVFRCALFMGVMLAPSMSPMDVLWVVPRVGSRSSVVACLGQADCVQDNGGRPKLLQSCFSMRRGSFRANLARLAKSPFGEFTAEIGHLRARLAELASWCETRCW